MDPTQLLRERERRLLAVYGSSDPPKVFDAEDLECEDPRTAEHWVGVYQELIDFVQSVIEPTAPDQPAEGGGEAPNGLRAIELQRKVLELHLAYWTGHLDRLQQHPGPGPR